MNEKQLQAFIKWLSSNVPELKDASEEKVIGVIKNMLKTEKGAVQVEKLAQLFKEQTGMFRKGGKLACAVKKFQGGSDKEKVKAPNNEIQYWTDYRLRDKWDKKVDVDPYIYYEGEDGLWYDGSGSTAPVSESMQRSLRRRSYHKPSNKVLEQRRNYNARQRVTVDEDGNTAYILTTGYPKDNYNAIKPDQTADSVITRIHGFGKTSRASNKDFGVKFARKFPKTSEFFGFVPDFEKYKVMFEK